MERHCEYSRVGLSFSLSSHQYWPPFLGARHLLARGFYALLTGSWKSEAERMLELIDFWENEEMKKVIHLKIKIKYKHFENVLLTVQYSMLCC
jgi:hypothetical protein